MSKPNLKDAGAKTVEEVSSVAFGFMGSKALFVALHLGVFDKLKDGARTVEQLAGACGCSPSSMQKVVAANVATRLLVPEPGQQPAGLLLETRVANAPATAKFLVRGAPGDCGDYYRYQIDQQIWPVLSRLDASLAIKRTQGHQGAGAIPSHWYADAMADPSEAVLFTESQHAGSLGAAAFLSKQISLPSRADGGTHVLLDIAGGSGAFSISMCRRHPGLKCLLMDFPEVARTASRFVADAGFADRIECHGGNAISDPWPSSEPGCGADVVLLSYLLSAVKVEEVGHILGKAFAALRPGGQVVIHDFLLDGAASGPPFAALWLFTHEAITPGSPTLTSPTLLEALQAKGFTGAREHPALPGITSFVFATKPGGNRDGASPGFADGVPLGQAQQPKVGAAPPAHPLGDESFTTSIVVRYSECDMQGVVFNAHYLAWADEAVDQFVRSRLGMQYEASSSFEYMWKKAEITYHKPARHMDRIEISVAVSRWGNTSFTVSISGKNQLGEECFSADNVAVCIDRSSQRPTPVADDVKDKLSTGSKL